MAERLTLEGYRASLAETLSPEDLARVAANNVILPCACGDDGCPGWAVPLAEWVARAREDRERLGAHMLRGMDIDAEPQPVLA